MALVPLGILKQLSSLPSKVASSERARVGGWAGSVVREGVKVTRLHEGQLAGSTGTRFQPDTAALQSTLRAALTIISQRPARLSHYPHVTPTPGDRNTSVLQQTRTSSFLAHVSELTCGGSRPRRGGSFDRYIIHHYIKECSGSAPKIVPPRCVRVLGWVRPPHSELPPRPAPPMAYVLTLRCCASLRLASPHTPKHSRPTHLDV